MITRSFIDCQINIDKYKKVRRINKGGFGIVYLVQQVETGQIYAAKVIDCNDNKELCKKIIDREIEIMIYANHPTIVNFIGYSLQDFQNENNIIIFMELAENGSLYDVIQSIQKHDTPKDYSNTIRQLILIGVSRGMKYLHDRNIIHRDLKPGNILLDREFHPHISDFGMSKFYQCGHTDSQSQNGGTLQYMAPEIIEGEPYDTKADVYSFGIIMYEVISDLRPYPEFSNGSLNQYNFTQKVINENYRPIFNFPIKKSIQNLIEKCWSKSRDDRPNFKELFNKLAYGKSEDDDENNGYFLDEVDSEKILKYVYEITEITDPIEKLNSQIEKLDTENKALKISMENLDETNKKLEEQNVSLLTKNDQLSIENKQLSADNDELLTNNRQLILKNDKLETENKHLSINNNRLLSDGKKFQLDNEKLTVENSQLMVNCQHLTDDNKQLQSVNKQLKEDNRQLLSHNDMLTKDIEKFSSDKKQLILRNDDFSKRNTNLQSQNEKLSVDNKKLSVDNKKLMKDNKQLLMFNRLSDSKKAQLSNSIQSLNDQIKILSEENDELSNDLQNIMNEYEIQIVSNNSLKFVKDLKDIKINQFNSLPLILQKLTISELISNSPKGEINQFTIKVNNLMLFLLKFSQLETLNCLEVITGNNDQLLSEIKDVYSIHVLSNVTELLYSINEIESNDFISILKKFDFFSFVLNYPINSFNEIFQIISGLKSDKFSENDVQICIFVSGITNFQSVFQNDKSINCVRFDSFVKSIPSNSFKNCSNLIKIQFDNPSFLLSIDNYSFQGCVNLRKIKIPSSVTKIGAFSFMKCDSLKKISIPSSVVEIGESCFIGCKSLQKFEFDKDSKLKTIGYSCFKECPLLKEIKIPSSVVEIKESCFTECKSLQKFEFEENSNLKTIGASCFKDCSSLKEINIPSSVVEIKVNTFRCCKSLSKVTILFNMIKIGSFSFYKYSSLKEIIIPCSVTEIGSNSFCSCSSLEKVNIPSSVKKIGQSAFSDCRLLKNVEIPSSVTEIGKAAFMGCSSLTHISLPSSITRIEGSTFRRCISLKNVEIPFSVTSIGEFAFYDCSSLQVVEVPYTTKSIENNAFNQKF